MKLEEIKAYCFRKWKAYEDYPFGDIPICYGKVFAQIYPKQGDFKITLKCTADVGQLYQAGLSGGSGKGISLSASAAALLEHGLSGRVP